MKHALLFAAFLFLFASGLHADADLSLTKSDSSDPVVLGANITYTLTISNSGPSGATNVLLTDALPPNLIFESVNAPEDWPCTVPQAGTSGSITCTKASLGQGESATLLLIAKPMSAGMINNTTTIAAAEPDPNTANNEDSEDTTVVAGPQK